MEEKAKQANIRENDVIVSLQSTCPENSLSAAAKLFLAAQIAQPRNLSSHPENERRFATWFGSQLSSVRGSVMQQVPQSVTTQLRRLKGPCLSSAC